MVKVVYSEAKGIAVGKGIKFKITDVAGPEQKQFGPAFDITFEINSGPDEGETVTHLYGAKCTKRSKLGKLCRAIFGEIEEDESYETDDLVGIEGTCSIILNDNGYGSVDNESIVRTNDAAVAGAKEEEKLPFD